MHVTKLPKSQVKGQSGLHHVVLSAFVPAGKNGWNTVERSLYRLGLIGSTMLKGYQHPRVSTTSSATLNCTRLDPDNDV
jgi:hypothetical protein